MSSVSSLKKKTCLTSVPRHRWTKTAIYTESVLIKLFWLKKCKQEKTAALRRQEEKKTNLKFFLKEYVRQQNNCSVAWLAKNSNRVGKGWVEWVWVATPVFTPSLQPGKTTFQEVLWRHLSPFHAYFTLDRWNARADKAQSSVVFSFFSFLSFFFFFTFFGCSFSFLSVVLEICLLFNFLLLCSICKSSVYFFEM